jgi:ComF family protein
MRRACRSFPFSIGRPQSIRRLLQRREQIMLFCRIFAVERCRIDKQSILVNGYKFVRAGMRIASFVQDTVMPERCAFCGIAGRGVVICDRCRNALPIAFAACGQCAVPLASAPPNGISCGACQTDPPMFYRAIAAARYEFPIDTALKSFKFDGRLYYAPAFVTLLLPLLKEHFSDADALVPVPLHRWRHARRGFNQAREICRLLARASKVPMITAVDRVRATPSQSGLAAAARRRNLRNAFTARKPLRFLNPVIVDDVMTTGETCRQIARVLVDAGAKSVGVLVVARA